MLKAKPHSTVSSSARFTVVWVSAALFVLALFLPALEFQRLHNAAQNSDLNHLHYLPYPNSFDTWKGGQALAFGLFGLLGGGQMEGYANPFLWIAWVFLALDRIRSASHSAIVAAALSLLTFRLYRTVISVDPANATYDLLIHMHIGAWLWFASLLLTLTASLIWRKREVAPVIALPPYAPPPPNPNLRY